MDLGFARAANVHGTGRHSDVFSYLAGPVFIPQDIAILTLTFMRWWGPPGSVVRFPVMAADSFSGDGRGAMPGQLAAELTIGFCIPWPFALAWII